MNVVFPVCDARYYHSLYPYILSVFKHAKCDVHFSGNLWTQDARFVVEIDDVPYLFDLSDFETMDYTPPAGMTVLKRTMRPSSKYSRVVHPMGPILGTYRSIGATDVYDDLMYMRGFKTPFPIEREVLYGQRVYGNARARRAALGRILPNEDLRFSPKEYWHYATQYRYNVFLPGANEYVLDRGPAELMFLGKTIIHPKIEVYFPEGKQMREGVHYVEMDSDGLNVLEVIKKCDDLSIQTGESAKRFLSCLEPDNLIEWWTSCS